MPSMSQPDGMCALAARTGRQPDLDFLAADSSMPLAEHYDISLYRDGHVLLLHVADTAYIAQAVDAGR